MRHVRLPKSPSKSRKQAKPQQESTDAPIRIDRQTPDSLSPEFVMQLQRTIGNQATRGVIQRLMSHEQVTARGGAPSKRPVRGREKAYKNVVQQLENYQGFLESNEIEPDLKVQGKMGFRGAVMKPLSDLTMAAQNFVETYPDAEAERVNVIQELIRGCKLEIEAIDFIVANYSEYVRVANLRTVWFKDAINVAHTREIIGAREQLKGYDAEMLDADQKHDNQRGQELQNKIEKSSQSMIDRLDQNPAIISNLSLSQIVDMLGAANTAVNSGENPNIARQIGRILTSPQLKKVIIATEQAHKSAVYGRMGVLKDLPLGQKKFAFPADEFVGYAQTEEDLRTLFTWMKSSARNGFSEASPWIDELETSQDTRLITLVHLFGQVYPTVQQRPAELDKFVIVKGVIKNAAKDWQLQHTKIQNELAEIDKAVDSFQIGMLNKNTDALINQLMDINLGHYTSLEAPVVLAQIATLSQNIQTEKVNILNEKAGQLKPSELVFKNRQRDEILGESHDFLRAISKGSDNVFNLPEMRPKDLEESEVEHAPVLGPTHSSKLTKEQTAFLAGTLMDAKSAFDRGFIARYQDDPAHFKKMIAFGSVMWTLDVQGVLSIGSERQGNKHAVVSGGMDVWGAGKAEIESAYTKLLSDGAVTRKDLEQFINIEEWQGKIDQYKQQGMKPSDYKNLVDEVGEWTAQLGAEKYQQIKLLVENTTEEMVKQATQTVVLDFDSGHYQPKLGWKKAHDAWTAAGFNVKWNSMGRFV